MNEADISLQSHPHLQLHQHIQQIKIAVLMMQQYHSPETVSAKMLGLLENIADLHDVGKSTIFFQEYIKDPLRYRGNKAEKAHTGLSVFFSLLWLSERHWDSLDMILVAAVIGGHHSRLPILPERKIGSIDNSEYAIDRFLNGDNAVLLKKQIEAINFKALEKETGIGFSDEFTKENTSKKIRNIKAFLHENLINSVKDLEIDKAVEFRLYCQLAYSLLLEADKALLAVSNPEIYLTHSKKEWHSEWVEQRIGNPTGSETNDLRQRVRQTVLRTIEVQKDKNIFSLTAPTGVGKTLLAASWALKMREKSKYYKKIIVVLPFLSVIDQTVKEYKKLLEMGGIADSNTWLLTSHSLSERVYDYELSEKDNSFLVDTWRGEVIITTYDQFLLSLMEPVGKYQMRFHNLCDALIVMDEVQSLPCKLWKPLSEIFKQIVKVGNSKLLLMSATLPPFVKNATPLLEDAENYFTQCKRYVLRLRLEKPITMDDFCLELEDRLPNWIKQDKRILLTFNTRKSARKVRDYIADWRKGEPELFHIPLYFISADVTPKDRLQIVDKIKCGKPCIVVSTQCIEAGVDMDMDLIIRDFAPLDSLIQIAGRCNREGRKTRGIVEVIDIIEEDKRYSDFIYDKVHLAVTRELLRGYSEVLEEDVFEFSERYFNELSTKKDIGQIHLDNFAKWQDDISVKELLRGKEKLEYTFLVLSEDLDLKDDIVLVCDIQDRWDRREGWRKLAGRIAMISVSVFARPRFYPESIAENFKGQWVLRAGYYSSEKGLLIEGETMII